MKIARRPPRATARGGLGLAALGTIALLAVLASGLQFMRLLDVDRELDAVVREDAMWAIFQSDRHLREVLGHARLISETGAGGLHDRFMQSFDILYSRLGLLERGTFLLDLSTDASLATMARDVSENVLGLTDRIDALRPDLPDYQDDLAALVSDLEPWVAVSNELLLHANTSLNTLRVGDRAARSGIQDRLAWLALVLILAFLGIFALLIVQLRQVGRANRYLALLQKRSGRQAIRAQAASRAKSAFLATMSHEIRTPLNGIIGSAELLGLQALPEGMQSRLDTITAQAFLLRDLIDGILDFSRLEAGVIETARNPTDLVAMGRLLERAFAQQAASAGLDLTIRMPAGHVALNDGRLRQLLMNLIGNALKFTHQGRVQVRGDMVRPDLLRIEVQDDGIGIAPADMPRLFREFSQIDGSHSRTYGGSGLGLAICHRIVQRLGGRIGAHSEPGHGSLFWFELPVLSVEPVDLALTDGGDMASDGACLGGSAAPLAVPGPERSSPSAVTGRSLDILVAEDNDVNLEVISAMLRHLGHAVHIARNGREAVDITRVLRPDMVLMDMQMPEMDGLQATRLIRVMYPDLPIVGVTANAFAEDRRACMSAGMSDFLPKPVTTTALAAVIARQHADQTGARAVQDPKSGAPPDLSQRERSHTGYTQLMELLDALGDDVVTDLVDRFLGDLEDLRRSLLPPPSDAPPNDRLVEAQDAVLHSFKGAALTLGMSGSGHCAQDLRQRLPIDAGSVDRLLALAEADVRHARRTLQDRRGGPSAGGPSTTAPVGAGPPDRDLRGVEAGPETRLHDRTNPGSEHRGTHGRVQAPEPAGPEPYHGI